MACRTCSQSWEHHPHSSARRRSRRHTCSSRGTGSCTASQRMRARAQPSKARMRASSRTPTRSRCRRATSPSCLQALQRLWRRRRSISRVSRRQVCWSHVASMVHIGSFKGSMPPSSQDHAALRCLAVHGKRVSMQKIRHRMLLQAQSHCKNLPVMMYSQAWYPA